MPGIDQLIRTDYKAVDKRDELRAVLGWLAGDATKPPIVTDDGRPVGILNARSLMRRRLDTRAKVDNHLQATKALTPAADMAEVARRMLEFRASYLPVENERGRPAGYVRAIDVVRHMNAEFDAGAAAINVTNLKESSTLGDALHVFGQEFVDVLPVVDPFGRILGVVHRRQVLLAETAERAKGRQDSGEPTDPLQAAVGGIMDTATVIVSSDTPRDSLLDVLDENGYAVVHDRAGRYQGIVTPSTLLERSSKPESSNLPPPPSARDVSRGTWHRHG